MISLTDASSRDFSERRIGLLAGWGSYPIVVADAMRAQGYDVYCLGIREHADDLALGALCTDYRPIVGTRLGGMLRYFRRHGVKRAVMAGKIHKKKMHVSWFLLRYLPDLWTWRTMVPMFLSKRHDRRDDTILAKVADAFAAEGVAFAPATDFAPELLVKRGTLTRRRPTASEEADIAFGWNLAKEMGRLDVGQSVAVKHRSPLAVEAIEGTDACIRRAGELCAAGAFTVVKVAKPQQDMRFDVPTVGVGTIRQMVDAGASCLAVEADKTIFLDRDDVLQLADAHKLAIVALHAEERERGRGREGETS